MKITFSEHKAEFGQNARAHAEKRLSKLSKFIKGDIEAAVKISLERGIHTVETTVISDHITLRAQEKDSDALSAFDSTMAIIDRQIERNKAKIDRRMRTVANERTIKDDMSDLEDFDLIRRKRFELKPMTVDEAILQMNLLGHTFYAFKNSESGNCFSIVYVRNDKGYGLIEDE